MAGTAVFGRSFSLRGRALLGQGARCLPLGPDPRCQRWGTRSPVLGCAAAAPHLQAGPVSRSAAPKAVTLE